MPTTTDREWRLRQGPRYRVELSPGSIRITATDYQKKSASDDARIERHIRQNADMLLQDLVAPPKRGKVSDWSDKSRARMPYRFATLDYSKMFDQGDMPALITLTYPMEWQRLTPDAPSFKKHVNAFRSAYWRSWGKREVGMAGIWKMEFQRRGAAHLHIGTTVPAAAELEQYREWVARTWSAIVFKGNEQAPSPWSPEGWANERRKHENAGTAVDTDEGDRYADPKRIGIYFAKHGLFEAKSYQNNVPQLWKAAEAGGALFWGYWVVKPLLVSKETHEALIMHIVRHLRAIADRDSYSRKTRVVKGGHNPRTGEIWEPRPRKRSVARRVKRWRNRNGYGYMIVNDGPRATADIARIIGFYGGAFIVPERGDYFDSTDESASGASSGFGGADFDLGGSGFIGGDDFDWSMPEESAPVGARNQTHPLG